jgi:hypothetical protein
MSEFIFMLTRDDMTVPDALDAYDAVRSTGLRCVGLKDGGVPVEVLRELTERIRADGRPSLRSSASARRTRSVPSATVSRSAWTS